MNNDIDRLDLIQRWMQAVVMHPAGVQAGVASETARGYLDVAAAGIERVVTRSRALSADARLGIYSRAYHGRLLECLRAEFPVLLHALGADLFDRFAFDYLGQSPSRTYTLARLGEGFPSYLAETRPDRDAPQDSRESWPDFIIDLATLERAFSEVFDGPGVEGRETISQDDIRELLLTPRREEARLVTVPCLRLLAFQYPVDRYFAAVRQHENPELPDPKRTLLAVTRRDYSVFLHELNPREFEFLGDLIAGESLSQAINRARSAERADTLPIDWEQSLCDWAGLCFFSAIGKPPAISSDDVLGSTE